MAFNVKKYKFRVQSNPGSYGKMGRVGLVGQKSIVVNGKKVRAGAPKKKLVPGTQDRKKPPAVKATGSGLSVSSKTGKKLEK